MDTVAAPRLRTSANRDSSLATPAMRMMLERYSALAATLHAAREHSPYRFDPRGAAKHARIGILWLGCLENGTPIAAMTIAPLQRLATLYGKELSIVLDGKIFSYCAATLLSQLIAIGAEIVLIQ